MIVWCAYCQEFRGEAEHFNQNDFTHGICTECSDSGLDLSDEVFNRMQELKNMQTQIWAAGKAGDLTQALDLMNQAKAMGRRSIDSMSGLTAPLLNRIGDLWKQGEVALADE